MTLRIGQQVKIRELADYSYDSEIPSLKPGSKGYVTEVWKHPYRDETQYVVRLADGEFGFYLSELERV